ncbi:NAD(P)H-dependent oxidoreductase [Nonomuraea bangladeshensis]|jgi:FMN-dependent NADH-azoreductase|uniref:FMN dependent NADH:quinone oxidoreductase n=1 Tax=Nonomuraea bangladeshensis TaxID=404385 RepID=A0ABV3H7U8_9ACTN
MPKLLHVSASPRGENSDSLRIARTFTDAYRDAHEGDEIEHWDLWDGSLPDFAAGARAKMTVFGGGEPQGEEAAAWAAARRAFERFASAERLLFSVPMWNGSVPYVLKQLIDVVSQPGWIFGVDPEKGYSHLLEGRGTRVAVVYTSAVWGPGLGPEFGSDFQSTYFTDWLRWTGLTDISEIRFHPTLTGDRDETRRQAEAHARELAKGF